MGDIVKKRVTTKSLGEKVAEREARRQEIVVNIENKTIENLAGKPKGKDKAISARVNGSTYSSFRKICLARGLTANACLNMLITDFVRENKKILDEEE